MTTPAKFLRCIGMLLLLVASSAFAQAKVGFVDLGQVMSRSSVAKAAISLATEQAKQREKDFLKKRSEIEKRAAELEKSKERPDVVAAKRAELVKAQLALTEEAMKGQLEADKALQAADTGVKERLSAVLAAIAASDKLDLVLFKDDFLFAGSSIVDLTDRAIRDLDQKK